MGLVAKLKCGFYYEQLTIDQKCIYKAIAAAVSGYLPSVTVEAADTKALHKIMMAVEYDNPEFFYWAPENSKINGNTILLSYTTGEKREAVEAVRMLREKRRSILQDLFEMYSDMNQKEALYSLYDYLVKNVTYAADELQKPACAQWIYDIEGPLLKGKGVCLGIAQTVNYLCASLHIKSLLITGECRVAGWNGNHGWNLVEMDGQYYHLDVTCDLNNAAGQEGRYEYFMLKDRDMEERKWPRNLYPKAV